MTAVPDLDAEQEVDFGRYGRAILARWWLPVAGLVVGAIIGALVTVGGGSSWKATTQVYLGQALVGGSLVSLAPTAITLASNTVTSDATIRSVAERVGVKPSKLSGHVTTKPVFGDTGTKVGAPTPIMAITVTGLPRSSVAAAANALGLVAVRNAAKFQTSRVGTLKQHLAFDTEQLAAVNERLRAARDVQAEILANKSLSPTERLLGIVNQNAVITQALAQQVGLQQDTFQVQQSLTLAQDIATARVVTQATAHRVPGPSKHAATAIGAVIGLIVGIFAALLWEPLGLPSRPQ